MILKAREFIIGFLLSISFHILGLSLFKIDLTTGFFIYLVLTLTGVFIPWIFFEYCKKVKHINPLEKVIFRCIICAHSYLIAKDETLTKCPMCGSLSDV